MCKEHYISMSNNGSPWPRTNILNARFFNLVFHAYKCSFSNALIHFVLKILRKYCRAHPVKHIGYSHTSGSATDAMQ